LVCVEQWAEIRRMHVVERLSIKEIQRRTGRDRKTIRRALRASEPPRYRRPPRPSKLDRSATRSIGCWAAIRACPASGSGS
jgi:transposase